MTEQIARLDVEGVEEAEQVLAEAREGVIRRVRAAARLAVAAQVGHQHAPRCGERLDLAREVPPEARETVDEHEGPRAAAVLVVGDLDAVHANAHGGGG